MPARLAVYFDGLCPLCSREIAHYRKRVSPDVAAFVDIAAPGFDPVALGFEPARVHRHLHARLDGSLYVGVDAFRALWGVVPGFRWLRTLTGWPVVYQVSKVLYAVFARLRPLLPKRKAGCDSGRCEV